MDINSDGSESDDDVTVEVVVEDEEEAAEEEEEEEEEEKEEGEGKGEDEVEEVEEEAEEMGQTEAAEAAVRQAEAEGLTLHRSEDNATGYRGVRAKAIKGGSYQATVWRAGDNVHLGTFGTAEEAALAYARTPEAQAWAQAQVTKPVLTAPLTAGTREAVAHAETEGVKLESQQQGGVRLQRGQHERLHGRPQGGCARVSRREEGAPRLFRHRRGGGPGGRAGRRAHRPACRLPAPSRHETRRPACKAAARKAASQKPGASPAATGGTASARRPSATSAHGDGGGCHAWCSYILQRQACPAQARAWP